MARTEAPFMVRIVERWFAAARDSAFEDEEDPDAASSSSSSSSSSSTSAVESHKRLRSIKRNDAVATVASEARTRVGLEFQRVVPARVVLCSNRIDTFPYRPVQLVVALESDSGGWGRDLATPHTLKSDIQIKYAIVTTRSGEAAWEAHIPLFAANGYASLSSRMTLGDVKSASRLVRAAIAKRVDEAMRRNAHYSHTVADLVAEYAVEVESSQPPSSSSSSTPLLPLQKSSADVARDNSSSVSGGGELSVPVALDDDGGSDGDANESDDSDSSGVDTGEDGDDDEGETYRTRTPDGSEVEVKPRGGKGGGSGGGDGDK
jgi:hypothetical protein